MQQAIGGVLADAKETRAHYSGHMSMGHPTINSDMMQCQSVKNIMIIRQGDNSEKIKLSGFCYIFLMTCTGPLAIYKCQQIATLSSF